MKNLLMCFLLICSSHPVLAFDTTGCSPMLETPLKAATALGGRLEAVLTKPPRLNCWNVNDAGFKIKYSWSQAAANSDQVKLAFWMKVNGIENFVEAVSYCQLHSNTRSNQFLTCTASVFIRADTFQKLNIEVAPVRDGVWDTKGYNENYFFNF